MTGLRVVHWYPNFLGGGGVANAVTALAEAQARAGADVVIAAAEGSGARLYDTADAVAVPITTWRPALTIRGGGLVFRAISRTDRARLKSLRPDLVHAHGEFNPDNLWPRLLWDAPVVLSAHGAFHGMVLEKTRRRAKAAYLAVARRLVYRRLAAFHALSPGEALDIVSVVPGAAVYRIPQGPGPLVEIEPGSARESGETAPVRFVTVGRLDVFTKGLDLLAEAFASLARSHSPRPLLTIVGPDWNGGRGVLEDLVRELGIEEHVTFTGPVSGHAIGRLLADADVYVQASRHEGFPLSVTEALVAGKPVIITDATGTSTLSELLQLEHIRIVRADVEELADAMGDFADRLGELRAAAGRAQPMLTELFSWDRIAKAHLERYSAIRSR